MAHIQHGILCSHIKGWVHVLCQDMDESGNHHSQQTDTRTENQTPHILTYRRVMNNENTWTQRGEHYTLGSIEGSRGGTVRGELGRDSMGRNARCGWRGGRHVLHMYPKTQNAIKIKKESLFLFFSLKFFQFRFLIPSLRYRYFIKICS